MHVVAERLGHEKIEMTLNIYAHVLPDMQKGAAAALGGAAVWAFIRAANAE